MIFNTTGFLLLAGGSADFPLFHATTSQRPYSSGCQPEGKSLAGSSSGLSVTLFGLEPSDFIA